MKSQIALIAAVVLVAGVAAAATIKVWTEGESILTSQLNNNFSAINTQASRTLSNSDLAANANIASSKLAAGALIPRAWATVKPTCTTGTCTIAAAGNVSSIVWNSSGSYSVTLSYTPTDVNYAALVTAFNTAFTTCGVFSVSSTAPHINIRCFDTQTEAPTNSGFSVLVMDNN